MKKYTLNIPENYEKIEVPGLCVWIAALRSGEYKQGMGSLCRIKEGVKSYCCLGVRLQTQGKLEIHSSGKFCYDSWGEGDKNTTAFAAENPDCDIFENLGKFPKGVTLYLENNDRFRGLAQLNDHGFSFSEIADILEKLYIDK